MAEQQDTLLRVRGLKTHFRTEQGTIRAVDGIDFDIKTGRDIWHRWEKAAVAKA